MLYLHVWNKWLLLLLPHAQQFVCAWSDRCMRWGGRSTLNHAMVWLMVLQSVWLRNTTGTRLVKYSVRIMCSESTGNAIATLPLVSLAWPSARGSVAFPPSLDCSVELHRQRPCHRLACDNGHMFLLCYIAILITHDYPHQQYLDNTNCWGMQCHYDPVYRVTWGKAPPRGKAPPPLSNYEFTHASGSISWLTMHHDGKVFMRPKKSSWIAIWVNSACLNFLRLFL